MRIRKGHKVEDYHIELEFQDAERLQRYCSEADMKYSSVIRHSLRRFLDAEEKKQNTDNQLVEEETVQSVKK